MNLYMPSHPTNLPLIPIIKDQITILIKDYPTHKVKLARDFDKGILLVNRIHKGIPQIPNQEDKDWAQFMQA